MHQSAYAIIASNLLDKLFEDIEGNIRNAPYGLTPPPIQGEVYKRFWHDLKTDIRTTAALQFMANDPQFRTKDCNRFLSPLFGDQEP